jgi:uncharacterized membrane protein YgcG
MKDKTGWNLIGKMLAIFLILASIGVAVDYPKAVEGKYLYDTAGKLTAQEFTDLNKKLVNYQQQTTNEIAVVTTQSLQGQSLEEYAQGLFNFWGVGRADVNNGVLILLSLDENDRGVWIQPGDGIAGDINGDSIANDDMIPYFKKQEWSAGLNAGVDAVIEALPTNWPAATTSAQVPNSVPVSGGQAPTSSGDGSGFLYLIAIIVAIIIVLLIAKSVLSSKARAKKEAEEKEQKEAAFRARNLATVKNLRDQLDSLGNMLIAAQKSLDKLKASYPQIIWEGLASAFKEITATTLQAAGLELDLAEADAQKNEERQKIGEELAEAGEKIASYIRICADTEKLLKKADQAKGEAQSALAHLPERIAAAQEVLKGKDVTDKARGMLSPAEERFSALSAEYEGKDPKEIDWIRANTELQEMSNAVSGAVTQAREDQELGARTEGPKMLAQIDDIKKQLDEKEAAYRDSSSARAEIAAAREKITEVQQLSSGRDPTDWLTTYMMLNAINSHNNEADRAHHAHVQRVEQEHRDALAAEAHRQRQAEEARHKSTSFNGGHSSISSSPSFSGGHSGGGGGGGKF